MKLDPMDKLSARIAELEEERDIFKRTLDKRDTELAAANEDIANLKRAIDCRCEERNKLFD